MNLIKPQNIQVKILDEYLDNITDRITNPLYLHPVLMVGIKSHGWMNPSVSNVSLSQYYLNCLKAFKNSI